MKMSGMAVKVKGKESIHGSTIREWDRTKHRRRANATPRRDGNSTDTGATQHQEGDFDSERADEQGRRRCTDGETNGGGSGGGRDLQIPGHPDNRPVAEGDGTGETKNEKGCDAAMG